MEMMHPMLSFPPQEIVPGVFSFNATRWPSSKVRILFAELEKFKSPIVVQSRR